MSHSITLGKAFDGMPFMYELNKASNHNVGIVGFSGTGKTYTIKQFIRGYYQLGITTFIIDIHDDLDNIPGIDNGIINNIVFSYSQGNGSVNPLRVYPNEGPYVSISNFIQTCKLFSPQMGSKQASTIRRLTRDLYTEFGILLDDPATWLNPSPKLTQLLEYAKKTRKLYVNGLDDNSFETLKKAIKSNNKNLSSDKQDVRFNAMAEFGEQAYDLITNFEDADEDPIDVARLDNVIPLLEDMTECGLFGEDAIDIQKRGGINRFVIANLSTKDQLVMINLLLERIFNFAVRGRVKDNPAIPRMMVIFDEGKIAKEISKNLMSPLNRITTEARGFGLGILMAVQSPTHLTEDVIENCALFLVLKLHPSREKSAQNMLSIPLDDLQALVPKKNSMIFFNHGNFTPVNLFV